MLREGQAAGNHLHRQVLAAGGVAVDAQTGMVSAAEGAAVTRQQYLQMYRALYAAMWGRPIMAEFLRTGAHYMLMDDHEVKDNADDRT